jgi:hypothetical protein
VAAIGSSRTKTKSPQTKGIVERLHKTMLNEFYRVVFRKSSMTQSRTCRTVSTNGSEVTVRKGRIIAWLVPAAGRHRRRRSWTLFLPCVIERKGRVPVTPRTNYTPRQGQYPAIIYSFTKIYSRAPAEANM